MLEVYAFEMKTGRRLVPLPVSSAAWSVTTNEDETMSASVLVADPRAIALDLWRTTTLARNGLLFVVDGLPVAAGPIWKRTYSQDSGKLDLVAGALRSYWQRRVLPPPAARTAPLVDVTTGEPDTSLDTSLSGLSLGTIAKRYLELAQSWPGGSLPLVLPADELGTRERSVAAVDLKTVRELLQALTEVRDGPDMAFRPRFAADGLGIEWVFEVGTEATPRLGNADPTLTKWTVGAPTNAGAFDLVVAEDGTGHVEEAWAVGGASTDRIVAARSRSTTLADAGFPLLQGSRTGLSDVSVQATMQGYADQLVDLGAFASSFWSLKVRPGERGAPRLGDYWLGDLATVTIDERETLIPPGDYVRRIAAISGDEHDDVYSITFAEALS